MSESTTTETETAGTTEEQEEQPQAETPEAPDVDEPKAESDDTEETESSDEDEPKVYDESHMKSLRAENRKYRKRYQEKVSELEKAQQEIKTAKADLERYKHREQITAWATEVSTDTGVPAEALRGSTREELEAHAEILRTHFAPKPGVGFPRRAGTGPEKTPARSLDEIQRQAYEQSKTS